MSTEPATPPFNPVILAPGGRPARIPDDAKCPQCGAGADQRVPTGGFGVPGQACQRCGYEFPKE
jgi:rubredoxin